MLVSVASTPMKCCVTHLNMLYAMLWYDSAFDVARSWNAPLVVVARIEACCSVQSAI